MTTKDEAREQLKELLWDVHHGRRQPLAALIDAEQFAAAACQPSTLEMLTRAAYELDTPIELPELGLYLDVWGGAVVYRHLPADAKETISREDALALLAGTEEVKG